MIWKIWAVFLMFIIMFPTAVCAFIPINAPSAVLIDEATGTVLFGHNENARMYPAGLTKMLTAIVALDFLDPDEVVVVGTEIYNVPAGALRSGHQTGEHITVHNLLRGLMVQNGNDSAAVLAMQSAQRERNNTNIPYSGAMQIFSGLMNHRARELGARGTRFANPGGLHHDEHYTTAYDLAIIARAYMAVPILREIALETEFTGNSLSGYVGDINNFYGVRTIDHHWINTNELLSGGAFHYHYATGIRSGSTPQASDNIAASAERRGVRLIAVVLGSEDPGRWQDARMLFDYGFATYEYYTIVENGQHAETVVVSNAKLSGTSILDVHIYGNFTALMSQSQVSRLERLLIFDNERIAYEDGEYEYDDIRLMAPVEENETLGSIVYILDGEVIFEGELRASAAIEERTLDSDMDFYIALIRDNIFSLRALPYWMGGTGLLVGIAGITLAIMERRRNRTWFGRR